MVRHFLRQILIFLPVTRRFSTASLCYRVFFLPSSFSGEGKGWRGGTEENPSRTHVSLYKNAIAAIRKKEEKTTKKENTNGTGIEKEFRKSFWEAMMTNSSGSVWIPLSTCRGEGGKRFVGIGGKYSIHVNQRFIHMSGACCYGGQKCGRGRNDDTFDSENTISLIVGM